MSSQRTCQFWCSLANAIGAARCWLWTLHGICLWHFGQKHAHELPAGGHFAGSCSFPYKGADTTPAGLAPLYSSVSLCNGLHTLETVLGDTANLLEMARIDVVLEDDLVPASKTREKSAWREKKIAVVCGLHLQYHSFLRVVFLLPRFINALLTFGIIISFRWSVCSQQEPE